MKLCKKNFYILYTLYYLVIQIRKNNELECVQTFNWYYVLTHSDVTE